MKYFAAVFGLALWLACTLFLSFSIIGIVVVMLIDEYWEIPTSLLRTFDENADE